MTITLWQFVTGDWEGRSFGATQIVCLIILGLYLVGAIVALSFNQQWFDQLMTSIAQRKEPALPNNAPQQLPTPTLTMASVSGAVLAPDLFPSTR